MPTYQIKVRDEAGNVTRVVDLEGDDDGEAIAALTLQDWAPGGGGLELWLGDRCVMVGYLSGETAEPLVAVG